MRDYKNVKVPRTYRTSSNRVTIKRVGISGASRRSGSVAGNVKSAALKFLVIMVIAAGSWVGWQSYRIITHAELFQISGVDVKGVRQLNDAELKNIVGAFTGQNIFRADLDGAVRRAKANPRVKAVRIYRRLPNRISLILTERVPCAILDTGRERFLMDSEGVVIERLTREKASAGGLPLVVVKDSRAKLGDQMNSESMGDVLMLLSEIAARGGWRLEDVAIKAGTPESLSIVYAEHEFKVGSGNYAEKLRRLSEVMADVKQRGLDIAYVDLRPDRQVAVMVRNAGGKGRP